MIMCLLLFGTVALLGAEAKTQEYYEKNIEEAEKVLKGCDNGTTLNDMDCVNALLAIESSEENKKKKKK
jgi:hypothetical protein